MPNHYHLPFLHAIVTLTLPDLEGMYSVSRITRCCCGKSREYQHWGRTGTPLRPVITIRSVEQRNTVTRAGV
jgi:hypothetical protein